MALNSENFKEMMNALKKAKTARGKFKKEFWEQNKDNINLITIGEEYIEDENGDESLEDYCIKVYLFDVTKATDFPPKINDINIMYLPVIEIKDK